NHFYQEWLQNTFADAVRAAAHEVLGKALAIRFAIDPQLFQEARQVQAKLENAQPNARAHRVREADRATAGAENGSVPANSHSRGGKGTRRWLRLADFVIGPCNRVAHASALSLIEMPGPEANPLVLHGPVGTGKTHLLEGVYAGLRKHHPDWRVCYVTAEDFTNRFVQAMRFGKLGAFRKHFRECDSLLIDDLDFLASKRATQEEFLHTFDVLFS